MGEIFRAYDIRGVYQDDLTDEIAYKIGRAFVTFLNPKVVVLGRDMRNSSVPLHNALAKGITDQGADVIDIGMCTTPMLYFAIAKYGRDSGIMITASHNPSKYNGFKLNREKAIPISGETGIQEVKKLAEDNKFEDSEKGNMTTQDILDDYIKHVHSFKGECTGLKTVVDSGNGITGMFVEKILGNCGFEMRGMYLEPDGSFPNHEPNPMKPENMVDLQKAVVEDKADLGIAFDGDGDRCAFVDEKGKMIPSDMITALIAKELLKAGPAKIMYDLRSSRSTKEDIEAAGGEAIMCRVGHAFIKKQMRDTDSLFAGELSGHYYYKDNFFFEGGFITALKVLAALKASGKTMSELIAPLCRYFPSGEINSDVEDKQGKMKEIEAHYKDKAKNIFWLDGVSVEFEDFWFNVRPSNTEPLLRLNLEAKTPELMKEKLDEVLKLIRG